METFVIIKKGRKGYISPLPQCVLARQLEKVCSYKKQGAEFFPNPLWAIVKLYSIKTGSFPWGCLDIVLEQLKEHKVIVKQLKKPEITFVDNPKLRPYQREAVKALIENEGGILSMGTGGGKTFTCLEYLKQYGDIPVLVLCPTIDLVRQWKKQTSHNIVVQTYQSIKDYTVLKKYQIIVMDECHIASIGGLYCIAMKLEEQILVGLSGSAYRIDGETMKMTGALGKIVYHKNIRDLIDEGYLCEAEIEFHNLTAVAFLRSKTYREIYEEYVVNNYERNDIIIDCCNQYQGKRIIILVNQINHGHDLLKRLGDRAIFWNSQTKDRSTNREIIIGTSILDQGIDLPEREIIVLAGGGQSSIKVLQRIGRVLRNHPGKGKATIIDFIDRTKYLFQHYEERRKIYEEYGFSIKNRQM